MSMSVARADLPEMGFLDPQAARSTVGRVKLRERLGEAQSWLTALLDVLDSGVDADSDPVAALLERCGGLGASDPEGVIDERGVFIVESRIEREQQLLEGVDLVLQFLDALGVGVLHGAFLVPDVSKRKRLAEIGHCLSGAAK